MMRGDIVSPAFRCLLVCWAKPSGLLRHAGESLIYFMAVSPVVRSLERQWLPIEWVMQKDGRYPVDVFAVWPEGSQFLLGHLPAVARAVFWLPIAPCVSSILHAASAFVAVMQVGGYRPQFRPHPSAHSVNGQR